MNAPTTLSLSQLRQVLNRLLDEVASRNGGDQIQITDDYYWALNPTQIYDVYETPDPARMTVGQLSEDLVELTAIATTSDPPVIWHGLSHVVAILQWLATQDRA